MKEEIFLELNFIKVEETVESSGAENDWYYYTLDIGDICLITPSNDEIKDDNWDCYFFESNDFRICNETDLRDLVSILNRIKKTKI